MELPPNDNGCSNGLFSRQPNHAHPRLSRNVHQAVMREVIYRLSKSFQS